MHRGQLPRLPSTAQVVRGVAVNIVLKQDQPTGRTISGTVRDILTRGNHPRGIKVRLADGRIGRVQSIAAAGPATPSSAGPSVGPTIEGAVAAEPGPGDQGDGDSGLPRGRGGWGSGRGRGRGGHSLAGERGLPPVRGAEDDSLPVEEVGLDAYIVAQAKPRGGRRRGRQSGASGSGDAVAVGSSDVATTPADSATCPVCGAFEGDGEAVAHHVAGHFDL